jgi:casein kinase 1
MFLTEPTDNNDNEEGLMVDKYLLIKKCGEGAFSTIFFGENVRTNEEVIIKTENKDSEVGLLKHEARMYMKLRNVSGVLLMKWYGVTDNLRCLVLPNGGKSLVEFNVMGDKWILNIFKKIIIALRSIHDMGIIHRDVKPANILISNENTLECKMVDLGLSTTYMGIYSGHIEQKTGQQLLGSPSYVSLNIHNGINPSRRDDIESACYVYLYMINNSLPWDNIETKYIASKKNKMEEYGNPVLTSIWEYIRKLGFSEVPDYDSLVEIIDELIK